jgi:hypothetical protein
MSGSIDASLFGVASGSTAAVDPLLSALYGLSGSVDTSPADAVNALTDAETNQTKDIAAVAAQASVQADVAAFTAGVAAAKTPAALLANPAVLKVLLTANGLGDQIAYPALAQQALLSNTANANSLADQLANTAWKSTAATYQFATQGLAVIQQSNVQQTIANAYAEVTWRNSLDAAHPGLSNALTFRSEASTITSVDQILGDPILRDVVTTTLGLPLQIAIQPLEAQEKAISSQLDISQFSNPKFVDQFTQRYIIAKAAAAAATPATASNLDSLAQAAAGLLI